MAVLEKGCSLPDLGSAGFTLSTYNVLLPNSNDGWWIYKYYQKHVPMDQRAWSHRCKLTKSNILGSGGGADIVCVQETSADSFDADFEFMKDAGYDHVLHTKFRFRTATFFRRTKFDLKGEKHGDRTLTTLLNIKDADAATTPSIFVVNCHLTGGPSPDKRLRQVHDATEYIRKEMNKLQPAKSAGGGKKGAKVDAPASASTAAAFPTPAVVICGDFNEEGSTAVKMLLCEGLVPADYTQESIVITSKPKKQELGAFKDAHAEIYAASAIPTSRPPTLICPNLVEHFLLPCDGPAAPASPTPKLVDAVKKAFDALTNGNPVMSREDMEKWLVEINGQLGRGSEFRNAVAALEARKEAGQDEELTFDDFLGFYVSELREGKFWGVHHDLQRLECPVEGAGGGASFKETFDYVYFGQGLQVEAVREELSKEELERALKGDDPLPNAWQPSDHVMQTAAFRFI